MKTVIPVNCMGRNTWPPKCLAIILAEKQYIKYSNGKYSFYTVKKHLLRAELRSLNNAITVLT